jgi:hypothetical protein
MLYRAFPLEEIAGETAEQASIHSPQMGYVLQRSNGYRK